MVLFDIQYTLTPEEVADGLSRCEMRTASTSRLITQTVVLALVAVWCVAAFFISGLTEFSSLLIAAAALVLIPVMWFVPTWRMKRDVEQACEEIEPIHLWVFEDGIDFGNKQPEESYYHYRTFYAYPPGEDAPVQTLVWKFKDNAVVVVPRRVLSDEQWELLVQKSLPL